MKIEGKVAIVVGGANGIGRASCAELLGRGAKVVLADAVEKDGEEAVQQLHQQFHANICFVKCDVTQSVDIVKIFDTAEHKFGKVNIVLNTAGVIDEFNWQRCFDVNVGGCIHIAEVARVRMGKSCNNNESVVIFTSSVSGLRPEDWGPVYSASKHAVTAYARSLALPNQYNVHGIRFNVICPTTVVTNFLKQVSNGYFENNHYTHWKTIDKMTPEYVAQGFIKLVEDDSMNGQAMRVSVAHGHDFATFQDTPLQ